jgi:diacylglycerol kinase (ATP)
MLIKIAKKIWFSTKCSIDGLCYAFRHELAFKLEIIMVSILSPIAFYRARDLTQLLFLLFSLYAILIVELLNTAIETVVDRIGLEEHILSKHAKDIGSAAVFLSMVFFILVWGMVLWSL